MSIEQNRSSQTGLLLVDPYNDFLSPGGKLYPLAKEVAESVDLLAHLRSGQSERACRVSGFPTISSCRPDLAIPMTICWSPGAR
jgi:hypothetical protein